MPQGRPRKYNTLAASREARRNRDQQRYLQRQQPQVSPQIIAYEPLLPGDTPRPTPANTGLRISSSTPALSNNNTGDSHHQLADELLAWQDPSPPSLACNDAEYMREVQELQAEEKEQNAEFAEEDAAVAQYVQAAEATAAKALIDL